jgi:hypothetical protein
MLVMLLTLVMAVMLVMTVNGSLRACLMMDRSHCNDMLG